MKKRLANSSEIAKTLEFDRLRCPSVDMDAKHQEALAEGYKDEICPKCKTVLLAHHHLVNCPDSSCPMRAKDGKSLLEMILGE